MKCSKIFLIVLTALCAACEKQTVNNGQPFTFSVFNGLNDGVLLYGNYSGTQPFTYKYSQMIFSRQMSKVSFGTPQVWARYFASPDTLAKDQPVFDKRFDLVNGRSYTLYLLGEKTQTDHLFVENKFSPHKTGDSLTYLQVVNLSNDQPISVNIQGEANGSLIKNLPYKQVSSILAIPAGHSRAAYVFEFRDAASGDLLWTEEVTEINGANTDFNRFLYRNWAMIFSGKRNASDNNALKITRTYYQEK
ncbi:hypothetical protein D3H65_06805 [Paraflavitalea soli]|uniref:DUF4397 domain-containing protein n=1 Tax=Paraflavitalea soli TaxID=2315862 RepID=A0A3B7MQ51_9BACT|nr:DUF4397 domain-containing protein [Paraflavitalea soli]AXY73705.1 hypothetical protein D3H65_06805 [Paraflavitalea soli]